MLRCSNRNAKIVKHEILKINILMSKKVQNVIAKYIQNLKFSTIAFDQIIDEIYLNIINIIMRNDYFDLIKNRKFYRKFQKVHF